MGKKSGAPAPDYVGAAEQQAQASKDIASMTNYANHPNVSTPWGKQTWTPTEAIDPATGQKVTNWAANIELDPSQQAALDDQMEIQAGRSDAARGLLDQAASNFETPMDCGSLPSRSGNVSVSPFSFGQRPTSQTFQTSLGSPSDIRSQATDAIRRLQAPQMAQRRELAESELLNKGFAEGSEGWMNAMRDVDDAESRADLMAIGEGRAEAGQMFGQELQAGQFGNIGRQQQSAQDLSLANFLNQQETQRLGAETQAGNFNNMNRAGAIAEEQQRRGMTLNELNALLSGEQVNMPGFGVGGTNNAGGQAPDLMGAMQNMYGADADRANAKAGAWGQAGSLAALGTMMYLFSDLRLKRNIKHLGHHKGRRIVEFEFFDDPTRRVGVIAQENLDIATKGPGGFYMVDYLKVL